MILASLLPSAILLVASVSLLPDPVEMGQRSGRVLGAATACGVSRERVAAVRRTSLELIRHVGFAPAELRQAERALDRAMHGAKPVDCHAAVEAFERAERN